MKVSNIGAMRERVAIYAQTQAVDDVGDITTTWTQVATCWARMRPLSARQVELAGRDDAIRRYEMKIRYRTDITTNSRIVWRGRRFDVEGVTDETEQRQFLTVFLSELNA
ncbi:phage head closure protein [Methylosinus sp. Ce-a6]|uniref:phage head closure protein n=1 Tax=Methylosinus sp. Ce-a6 TaxID=2172005 RepID=UPI0013576DC0|nr:phage head closure protein [Methylosinus sp. Ce-a6]